MNGNAGLEYINKWLGNQWGLWCTHKGGSIKTKFWAPNLHGCNISGIWVSCRAGISSLWVYNSVLSKVHSYTICILLSQDRFTQMDVFSAINTVLCKRYQTLLHTIIAVTLQLVQILSCRSQTFHLYWKSYFLDKTTP